MFGKLSARRLENEVHQTITTALTVGRGGTLYASLNGRERAFVVDKILRDETGFPSEVWLSAPAVGGFISRFIDRIRGVKRRDLIRVMRVGGDVRRTVTTVEVDRLGLTHVGFREEIGAPRVSRSVATYFYPRVDAADWLHTYRKAS